MELGRRDYKPRMIWLRDLYRHWPIYVAGLFAMLITNGTEVLAPKTLQWMIDSLLAASRAVGGVDGDEAFHSILKAAALFVLVAFVGLLGRVFWRFTLARMTHVAGASLKRGIWEGLRSSSLESVQGFTLGDLMNRAIGDVNSARWIYGFTLVLTCDVIFFTCLGAISMLLIHPGLALACLSTFVIFPPIILRLAKREYLAHEAAQAELTTLSEYVSQSVRGVRAQRASDAFAFWTNCLGESAARYSALRLKAQRLAINSFPICSIPTVVSYIILFTWGSKLVTTDVMTVGEFAAMASYVFLLQGPISDLGELVAEWQKGFASVNRIAEITELPKQNSPIVYEREISSTANFLSGSMPRSAADFESKNQTTLLKVRGLKAVRGKKTLFEGLDLNLKPGEWLGVFGDVGSGKSTLLQSLSGLVPVCDGVVQFQGEQLSAERHQKKGIQGKCDIAYAPERPFVFSGTIRHNLELNHRYGDDELWRALEVVCLSQEVRDLPNGLDGIVGEGGVSLSGGQRQRLALARIVLRASCLVLLDDPLSAVDEETESRIITNLKKHWADHAIILSSNKIRTLDCCHRLARLTTTGLESASSINHLGSNRTREACHV